MSTKSMGYPKHAYASPSEFRKTKRQEIKRVIKALEELRMGCAYLPRAGMPVSRLLNELEELRDACSVKKWGR